MSVTEGRERQAFSVDIAGLLRALTEQFPEPLLCVRELVQNAADARSQRIEVDVAYDGSRELFRLSVSDDGRGMNRREVDGYLTIGFSEKDPQKHRGRFGVGKLSPYALGIVRMVVETCDGGATHKLTFHKDGSGTIAELPTRPRGTVVRVYKKCGRGEAERLAERAFAVVSEQCGSLAIPLFVNGTQVNRDVALGTPYVMPFSTRAGRGALGIAAEPVHLLMGGGIVLETSATLLGPEVSYILDSPRLSPTLSRNAVRRDQEFDELLLGARNQLPAFRSTVARQLRSRIERFRAEGESVERALDANDRAALEWLRSLLLDEDVPDAVVRSAPVLETSDGGLVSAEDLVAVLRKEGRVPISRVPRTRDEIRAYADRGVPVLLLYRDLEDFLERQAIETVEVDGLDDGVEIHEGDWGAGEIALARRLPLPQVPVYRRAPVLAGVAAALLLLLVLGASSFWEEKPGAEVGASRAVALAPLPSSPPLGPPRPTGGRLSKSDVVAPALGRDGLVVLMAAIVAVISAAAGSALIYFTLASRARSRVSWLRQEAGAPLTLGETRRRRLNLISRALFHPLDFFVARGWSVRASGNRPLGAPNPIKGYRELAPEAPIRSGVRLDLDRVVIGFVDIVSSAGDPHDGRILLRKSGRVLLNRNHPTVRDLIDIAENDSRRASMLLDVLLATDADLARGTDPRQVEWDLLGRAEMNLRRDRS